jgi:ribosomal protein S18 acetylase RimI-like enzyme
VKTRDGTSAVEIRAFEAGDAQTVFAIIEECLAEIDPGRHTPRGIRLQLEENTPERLIERAKEVSYFVAVRDGKPVGICGHDGERLRTLFVKFACQRQGIGRRLVEAVLEDARAERVDEIRTWSTEYALGFYERLGFRFLRDIYPEPGVGLIEMTKEL